MFRQLVVPLDGSALAESALAHAVALARPDATLVLIRVLEADPTLRLVDPVDWQLRRDEATAYLDEVARQVRTRTGLDVVPLVSEGRVADRILAAARDGQAEVIVCSSHGAGGLSAWNVNSTSLKVAQRAGVSLFLVRSYRPAPGMAAEDWTPVHYRRILVPLDGSLRGEHVLPTAARLAAKHDGALELVHVVALPTQIERLPRAHVPTEGRDVSVARARRYLDGLIDDLAVPATGHVLSSDDPYAVLEDLVVETGIDLVLLSAHGHSARRQWPHGSLTTSFMLHGGTQLLVLQDFAWNELGQSPAEAAVNDQLVPPPPHAVTGGEAAEGVEHPGR